MRVLTWGALLSFAVITASNAAPTPVRAGDWCGFHDKVGSTVQCGYSSLEQCRLNMDGKHSVCMPDPEFAMRRREPPPA